MAQSKKNIIELSNISAGILIKELIRKNKRVKLKARGESMFPAIRDGDVITIAPPDPSKQETGDIVVCMDETSERILIHRIISKSQETITTKGDFCLKSDGARPKSSIIGYVCHIKNDSSVLIFSKNSICKKTVAFLSRTNILALTVKIIKKYVASKMS